MRSPRGASFRMPRRVGWLAATLALASFTVACGEPQVLVIGLDGANWTVLDPLIDAGFTPNIGRLVREGASAELDCVPAHPASACFCPPVWTSMVTGVDHAHHRISNFETPSYRRGVRAIWNLAADHGAIVTTASWRGTWPPEPGIEFVLTEPGLDLAAAEVFDTWGATSGTWDLSLPLFSPPDLLEILGILPASGVREPTLTIFGRDRVAMESVLRLAEQRAIVQSQEEYWEKRADLTMILLHGPDKVAHVAWGFLQEVMYGPFDEARLLADAAAWVGPVQEPGPFGWGTVPAPYLEIDAWIGQLLSVRRYDYVVFLSDHGMTRNPGPGLSGHHNVVSTEAHRGIFALNGPGVRRGVRLGRLSVLDVAPTLAYLMGLPIAEDLPGRVVSEACYSSNSGGTVFSLCPGRATSSTASDSALHCDLAIPGCYHGTHGAGNLRCSRHSH